LDELARLRASSPGLYFAGNGTIYYPYITLHEINNAISVSETGGRNIRILDACRGRSGGTSETMAGTIIRLTLVQGTALFAAVLGLKGGYRSKPKLTLTASIILFLLSVPLIIGRAGLITLVCAVCFLLSFVFSYFVRETTV
jgi:hypothetical protein